MQTAPRIDATYISIHGHMASHHSLMSYARSTSALDEHARAHSWPVTIKYETKKFFEKETILPTIFLRKMTRIACSLSETSGSRENRLAFATAGPAKLPLENYTVKLSSIAIIQPKPELRACSATSYSPHCCTSFRG